MSQNSKSTVLTAPVNTEADMSNLSNFIIEWRRIHEETNEFRQQIKERTKRLKALDEVILRVMKANNIGALDLKNSGGRILYKKTKHQSSLGSKNLQAYISEYMKSEEDAQKVLKYINDKRSTTIKDRLSYENNT